MEIFLDKFLGQIFNALAGAIITLLWTMLRAKKRENDALKEVCYVTVSSKGIITTQQRAGYRFTLWKVLKHAINHTRSLARMVLSIIL